jgi:hypothetical protein
MWKINCSFNRCGDDFLLIMVHSTSIKVKSSKALGGIASSSWLDLNHTIPAFLAQTAAQVCTWARLFFDF